MALDTALLALFAEGKLAVLATIGASGQPHLTPVNYHYDPDRRLVRVSMTDDRVKVRNLRRDPRATLHVRSDDGWAYTSADADVELGDVTTSPDDEAMRELVEVYRLVAGREHPDWDEYRQAMIADRRLVARFTLTRAYGQPR